jgi:hypothetical protein
MIKKLFYTIITIFICVLFYILTFQAGETRRPDKLWFWQVEAFEKRAKAGDGVAQHMLSEYYLSKDDQENSDFWYTQCLMIKEPRCLLEEAGGLIGRGEMGSFGSDERVKLLGQAEALLSQASENSQTADIHTRSTIKKLRDTIDQLKTDPSYKP